jgi:phospholipid/cholesterol/gamma-HCH transport system permease protein
MFNQIFMYLGSYIVELLYFLGGLAVLSSQAFFWTFQPPFKKERLLAQVNKIGAESLPIVSLVALFIGIILALQTAVQMQRLGSEMYIASIVSVSVVREMGPVLTALIVAGRCGAAITAEIGTMTVTEQIDALQTFASNPVQYLVVPRYLAAMFMLPILTLYADIIGIVGGYLICVNKLNIASTMYLQITFDALLMKDLLTGLLKSMFFGMIIAFVGCYEGFNVKGGAEGVGMATTNSVVKTFIMILAADCFFTALFYFIFP